MSLYRIKPWLATWGLVFLMATPALAQEVANSQLAEGQVFDPSVPGRFGGGVPPSEGYFFTADALFMTISAPGVTSIGAPGLTRQVFFAPDSSTIQSNSMDTGFLKDDFVWGQRFELGDVVGHSGWLLSYYNLRVQSQTPLEMTNLIMTIDDREFGPTNRRHLDGYVADVTLTSDTAATYTNSVLAPLPLRFDFVRFQNFTDTWSVEWMYMHRTHPLGFHRSTLMEMFFGVRYMEFEDRFNVFGRGNRFQTVGGVPGNAVTGSDTILADSEWSTDAANRIVGPQVAVRLFTRRGRWTFSTEGRFFAGFNFQSIRQNGMLGTRLYEGMTGLTGALPENAVPFAPAIRDPVAFNHVVNANEFSPGVEFRADARLHLTRGLALRAGYTAVYIDGIARASNMIDYVWSETTVFGIRQDTNRQGVFMNGLHFGLEFNR